LLLEGERTSETQRRSIMAGQRGDWTVCWALVTWAAAVVGCGDGGTTLAGDGDREDATATETRDDAGGADDYFAADVPDVRDAPDADDAPGEIPAWCDVLYHWELEERTIAGATLVSEPARYGTTDRIRVEVQLLSSCERLGRVTASVMPGDATDFVTLYADAWAPHGLDCLPSAPLVPWIVEIEGRGDGNLRVVVTDGHSPGGGVRLDYNREIGCSGVPDCECGPGTPIGDGAEWSDCMTDCSCATDLSCITYFGVAGPLASCARSCNDFLDCGTSQMCLEPVPDGPPWVCTVGDQCSDDEPCPDGFECVRDTGDAPNTCVDRRAPPTVGACDCDEQCPAGQRCVLGMRAEPTCEIPCLRNADCPGRGGGLFVCGTAGICVPLA
jgi:hypothetical protein